MTDLMQGDWYYSFLVWFGLVWFGVERISGLVLCLAIFKKQGRKMLATFIFRIWREYGAYQRYC